MTNFREPSIQPDEVPPAEDRVLRPQRFSEMVGQRAVFERLSIAVDASRIRGEVLGHILLDGPPGLGKTTFATCIPRELGATLQIASGAALSAPKDLLPYLSNASEGSVLFIDEIHRLPIAVEEFLYPAMEDFRIDITLGEGVSARTINMPLRPFTLIGATTRAGLISAPMRDRFVMREHLDYYSAADLAEIVRRSAVKLSMPMDNATADEIARRSRGTPRLANNRLRWIRDFSTSRTSGLLDVEIARTALEMQGIDELGLDGFDRKYLETIQRVFSGGPVGLDAIAHTMSTAPDTLEDDVEPYMLRCELVVRTPRGRLLTERGEQHLGALPKSGPQARLF
ncbi:MAG: Holliday junction branch migration DNA helicase RuvB [Planctomycetia bacterium]|nr:Holliday junction branch migration DNA helicase RuvB [Planctomycetia bacterium]RLT15976.1 MAG: Holliday junction branch migration DNA helicase RuvB [Planctomycetota bacterium]